MNEGVGEFCDVDGVDRKGLVDRFLFPVTRGRFKGSPLRTGRTGRDSDLFLAVVTALQAAASCRDVLGSRMKEHEQMTASIR